jgi:hypothetical protein
MSSVKIDRGTVELAFEAADNALMNNVDLAWIRCSCIIERAYFMGLSEGLDAISDKDVVGRVDMPLKVLRQTLWARSADDTFPSTRIGKSFAALEEWVRALDKEVEALAEGVRIVHTGQDIDHLIATVIGDIDMLDHEWRVHVNTVRSLLSDIQSAASGLPTIENDITDKENAYKKLHQIHGYIRYLDERIRFIALLETHHEMSRRLTD